MICIPIIAGEGGSDNAKKLEKGLAGRCLTMRGGRSPLCTPLCGSTAPEASRQTWLLPPPGGRSAPPTPGDFPAAGKVTKGAPEPTVLDSLGAEPSPSLVLRCACTRATFCHKNRPICHFGVVGKSVLFSSSSSTGVTPSIFNPWRGRCLGFEDAAGLFTRNQYR